MQFSRRRPSASRAACVAARRRRSCRRGRGAAAQISHRSSWEARRRTATGTRRPGQPGARAGVAGPKRRRRPRQIMLQWVSTGTLARAAARWAAARCRCSRPPPWLWVSTGTAARAPAARRHGRPTPQPAQARAEGSSDGGAARGGGAPCGRNQFAWMGCTVWQIEQLECEVLHAQRVALRSMSVPVRMKEGASK